MHFLFFAFGSTGDVNPMLGVAAELQGRGHEVVFVSSPAFAPQASTCGLELVPVGSVEDYERTISDPLLWKWPGCVDRAFESWTECLRPAYELAAAHHRPGQTRVVANIVAVGARVAREKLDVKLATLLSGPTCVRSFVDPARFGPFDILPAWIGRPGKSLVYRGFDLKTDSLLEPQINALRSELGLGPPVKRVLNEWIHSPDLVVGLWPDWFAAPEPSWPPSTELVGFPNFDRSGTNGSSGAGNDAFSRGTKPIVFTCGSSVAHSQAFYEAAAGVTRILGRPGIFVVDGPFEPPIAQPEGLTISSYVPYSRLLPQAAALVHHGGIGTAAAALAAGIPQVIVPLAFDQFDNAHRFTRLGVAHTVRRWRLKPRVLARALDDLLRSAETAARIRELQPRVNSQATLRKSCELLEVL